MSATSENRAKDLKNIDFVVWRVAKAQKERHFEDVHRALSERPRQRRETKH